MTTTSKVGIAGPYLGPLRGSTMEGALGTTGFDVVGSLGRLRVEVPEAS